MVCAAEPKRKRMGKLGDGRLRPAITQEIEYLLIIRYSSVCCANLAMCLDVLDGVKNAMISLSLRRDLLVDVVVPGANSTARALGRREALVRDTGLLTLGVALIAVCMWLDASGSAARVPLGAALSLLVGAAIVVLSARPESGSLARTSALVLGSVALLAIGAHLEIPLKPVPITGQTFGVLLLAAALGWRRGFAAVALYVALGTAGLPVFAITSTVVTYGYLIGFAAAALVVGWLSERGWDRSLLTSIPAMLAGEVAIYACGLPWLAHFIGWQGAVTFGLTPFLVGDSLKLLAAALALPLAWRLTGKFARKG
ncbi:MAG: Substrate-specific component BioY of biotin ECF transporter [Ktedonobacterales bacterium]|jgi:biotin transporter BioY|nr:MAG: Substrate-specific component BioY of biotin ECF transporter [Ktedonobacterales bacterium]